ncbi:hypothetical protein NMY22_g19881 [Coprinellus aureogranulatus]|nr:hypothetical protein NMY22_g19881 [Coprinellus aureogranulatus]
MRTTTTILWRSTHHIPPPRSASQTRDAPQAIEIPSSPQLEVHEVSSDGFEPIPREPTPPPPVPEDPTTTAVASVLEMIPDVDPDHLLALVETHLPTYGPNQIVEFLVAHLFENPGYPRVERGKAKGKGRAVEAKAGGSASGKRKAGSGDEGGGPKKPKIDYASVDRPNTGGDHYRECAIAALQAAFPLIPLPYLRKKLAGKNGLYAPTYLEIRDDEEKVSRGEEVRLYKPKKGGGYGGVKGKGKEVRDEVFEEEKRWLDAFLDGGTARSSSQAQAPNDGHGADKVDGEEDDDDENLVDDGTFVECGCCFSTYPFDRMTTCPDAHLFCRSCLRQYAATELGSQNCVLKCMHTSGCTATFQEPELRRLLPSSLFSLYSRLKQQKELKEAGIEGLEECPFCDWACVIEVSVEVDRLFRCGNEDECGVVSCRMCRKREHVPKTCKEAEEDKHLGGRVAIEEAMTRALMRRCPKCAKEFIKSDGCNKMTCPNCRQLSCYVCKEAISGYDHFHQNDPRNPGGSSTQTKCPLWDSVDVRHDQEVKEAYQKALEDYKRDHPDVEVDKDLKIDLPKSPPKVPNALPAGYIDPNALAGGWAGGGGSGVS